MRQTLPIIAGALLLAAAGPADADAPTAFQVGLHGGFRGGGQLEERQTAASRDLDESGSVAVALEWRVGASDDRFYQLWYARQSTAVAEGAGSVDVDVEYLHVGGTLPFGGWERAQPYFAAGLGATRFRAADAGADDRTRFSGSMAVGLELPLARHVALRLEARGYVTFTDSDASFFCRSDGGDGVCRIVASSSTFLQGEALAGVFFRF